MFEPEISPCKSEFPDIEIKRQIIGHYLKDICHLTQQNGIYTIEISTPRILHGKYVIQTDDIDLEFSKVFTEYIKNIQYQNSQRANSIFTNEVFAIIGKRGKRRGKRRIKKIYKHKPVHLYNWNQPIRHIDNYILTVIKRKKEQHSK